MTARFAQLRIAGFKSFAEPTTLQILPGLTGIVGPNGCGKSNVVEALRWAMGEASAARLRGGEMDDVIFAGTAHRASRNIAEVTITLEETVGLAPPPFHEAPELQVTRRIERGVGSTFRVNGREARARDVHTLFADMATGARASAMVSQGRVTALVGARPEERRGILEEAAGITGLHARRHEAELKLRAAEANLERAEDRRVQLAAQLDGLRRQARQAARAREIGQALTGAEADLLALQRARAERERALACGAQESAEAAVAAATATAREAAVAANASAEAVPPLRAVEAARRGAADQARLAAREVAAEAERATAALAAATRLRDQTARDLTHAEQTGRDAAAALARLHDEAARLDAEAAEAPALLAAAEAQAARTATGLRQAEAASEQAIADAAHAAASQRGAAETLAAAQSRARRAAEQAARLDAELRRAAASDVPPERLAAALQERAAAEQALQAARIAADAADAARAKAQREAAQAREPAQAAEAARTRIAASAQGLAEALGGGGPRQARLLDELGVPAGLEQAVAAALGDTVEAATDLAAPRHWRDLPAYATSPALPAGAVPLAASVQAPAALARALSLIGLVEAAATAEAAQASLAPGQSLVTREGALWRSDGFCVRAGAPSAAAVRLQQRNRLAGLRRDLAEAEAHAAQARARRDAADAAEREAAAAEQQARAAVRAAEQRAARSRDAAGQLERDAAAAASQLQALGASAARLGEERAEAEAVLAHAQAAHAALPDATAAAAAAQQARGALADRRAAEQAARAAHEALQRADAYRAQRRRTLAAEQADWRDRAADAASRVTDLSARAREAAAAFATRAAAPDALAAQRRAAEQALREAESALAASAATLRQAEQAASAAESAARSAEAALAGAREDGIRAEAAADAAARAWSVVAERVAKRFGAVPALPPAPADCSAEAEERLRRRLERLARERDAVGPINQRAETEAVEAETAVATIERDAAEIGTAIAKLRGSIGHINREGREKLGQVFADIDRHFRSLFETMFGGGRAHLALVGSDDPLLAGLEIYAQPPGKKLATLSLLSGGEQALTALSLIFAVFRCNPAPVCVLDEVDAPLDDANVERFCDLLAAMVRETGTRFLVVTHHQLTMARMDRLYGVTMQERGVSRLLSVDLSHAAAMAEAPARLAAE